MAFDRGIRKGGARDIPLRGEAFLHRSCVPLDQAPIDRWTRGDIAAATEQAQGDLLDLLDDDVEHGLLENGDPDGCSPYGCRTGTAA